MGKDYGDIMPESKKIKEAEVISANVNEKKKTTPSKKTKTINL